MFKKTNLPLVLMGAIFFSLAGLFYAPPAEAGIIVTVGRTSKDMPMARYLAAAKSGGTRLQLDGLGRACVQLSLNELACGEEVILDEGTPPSDWNCKQIAATKWWCDSVELYPLDEAYESPNTGHNRGDAYPLIPSEESPEDTLQDDEGFDPSPYEDLLEDEIAVLGCKSGGAGNLGLWVLPLLGLLLFQRKRLRL